MDEIKKALGESKFEEMRGLIRRTFPDARGQITDALVEQVVKALPGEARAALGVADVALDAVEAVTDAVIQQVAGAQPATGFGVTYYVAHAKHERDGAGAHAFVGVLPMVRLRLPDTEPADVATAFGIVFAGDHKVHTRALVQQKYGDYLDFEVATVYLTTPARYLGARFGAIATYELFDVHGLRRGWILEAGMATGEAVMLYCSPSGLPITRKAQYWPTPFSSGEHYYRGEASFDEAGPARLTVAVCSPEELVRRAAHVTVTVHYEPAEDPSPLFPSKLTAEAGLRVAAIAVARGTDNPLFHLLAPFGRALPWIQTP